MIRLAHRSDLSGISSVMNEIFISHMQAAYTQEGRENFSLLIKREALQERFEQGSQFYLYEQERGIQGVLELEAGFHIAFLFVKDQGKGIGTDLCKKIIDVDNDLLSVAAFPDTVSFYQGLGFRAVDAEQVVNGMPFVLMIRPNEQAHHSFAGRSE